jgi:hypothetical protein
MGINMKNKYNIGDILTNESGTVELVVLEITGDYEMMVKHNYGIVPIITSIKYKLISSQDTLYVTEEMID